MLFLDESGTPPSRVSTNVNRYFVIGGVVIPEHSWHRLRDDILGLKLRSGVRGEVKWRYFAPENNDEENPLQGKTGDERNAFRSNLFKILRQTPGLTALACVTSTKAAYDLGIVTDRAQLYEATYRQVTERFQFHLKDLNKVAGARQLGMVVCDHRGRQDDARLKDHHEELLLARTRKQGAYPDLVEGLFLQSSHLSVGIQLADLIAGAVWRNFEKGDSRWLDEARELFRQRHGNIDGPGLVRFPKTGWK
jgi:hypothetical protein